jgi:hypothetical protein
MLRCGLVTDEAVQCMSVLEYLQDSHVAIAGWRDVLHRLNNFVVLAVAGVRSVASSFRRVRPVWRLSRGPWKTAKFGRMLREACLDLS